jgi:hypothetical protein
MISAVRLLSLLSLAAIIITLFGLATQSTITHAQATEAERRANCESSGSNTFLGLPTWYKYLETEYVDGSCNVKSVPYTGNPGQPDLGATVGAVVFAVIEILLRVAGIVAVGYVIYGGILYSISQGEPERLAMGRKTIINGLIGVVIAVFAVAIVNLITGILL